MKFARSKTALKHLVLQIGVVALVPQNKKKEVIHLALTARCQGKLWPFLAIMSSQKPCLPMLLVSERSTHAGLCIQGQ